MEIDFTQLTPAQVYRTVIQTLIPRPIAWVLSPNKNRSFNLAPFSYFNAISSDPPLIMLSVGKKTDGSFKDTRVNIEARQDFVLHIPCGSQAQTVTDSSASLANELSEVDNLQLETVPFEASPLPRIKDCPVAYYCRLFEILEMGYTPMSMIVGEIKAVYIDERIIQSNTSNELEIDAAEMDPLARLGGIQYATLGNILAIKRPK